MPSHGGIVGPVMSSDMPVRFGPSHLLLLGFLE